MGQRTEVLIPNIDALARNWYLDYAKMDPQYLAKVSTIQFSENNHTNPVFQQQQKENTSESSFYTRYPKYKDVVDEIGVIYVHPKPIRKSKVLAATIAEKVKAACQPSTSGSGNYAFHLTVCPRGDTDGHTMEVVCKDGSFILIDSNSGVYQFDNIDKFGKFVEWYIHTSGYGHIFPNFALEVNNTIADEYPLPPAVKDSFPKNCQRYPNEKAGLLVTFFRNARDASNLLRVWFMSRKYVDRVVNARGKSIQVEAPPKTDSAQPVDISSIEPIVPGYVSASEKESAEEHDRRPDHKPANKGQRQKL